MYSRQSTVIIYRGVYQKIKIDEFIAVNTLIFKRALSACDRKKADAKCSPGLSSCFGKIYAFPFLKTEQLKNPLKSVCCDRRGTRNRNVTGVGIRLDYVKGCL